MKSLDNNEHVYRAIKPKDIFVKKNNKISPSAFVDPKGLSVEIQQGRQDCEVEAHLKQFFKGKIAKTVKISTVVCDNNNISIFNDHSRNEYHRLLLDKDRPYNENEDNNFLTDEQAFILANACKDLD